MSRFFLTFLLPFVICSLIITFHANARSIPNVDLIEQACKNSADKTFCVNLLRSDHTSREADLQGLAFIAMKNVEAAATATSLSIKVSLDNPEIDTEPGVEDALADCSQHYLSLVELVEDSISAVVSNSRKDAKNFAGAVVDDLNACDASVRGIGGAAAQVAERNKDLHKLIDNAASVVQVSQSSQH